MLRDSQVRLWDVAAQLSEIRSPVQNRDLAVQSESSAAQSVKIIVALSNSPYSCRVHACSCRVHLYSCRNHRPVVKFSLQLSNSHKSHQFQLSKTSTMCSVDPTKRAADGG